MDCLGLALAFELVSKGKDLLGWIAWVWLWRLHAPRYWNWHVKYSDWG